jgi:hypothetical protein
MPILHDWKEYSWRSTEAEGSRNRTTLPSEYGLWTHFRHQSFRLKGTIMQLFLLIVIPDTDGYME